jgi:ABC-type protease/lipase transport system fused ATPase/permease subunit
MRNWQAVVSLERLDKYLWSSELEKGAIVKLPFSATAPAVKVMQASFNWEPEAENMTLTNINLHIPRGALVTVVGKVGSGKSSLLASLLGEMPKLSGEVIICKDMPALKYYAGSSGYDGQCNIPFEGKRDDLSAIFDIAT